MNEKIDILSLTSYVNGNGEKEAESNLTYRGRISNELTKAIAYERQPELLDSEDIQKRDQILIKNRDTELRIDRKGKPVILTPIQTRIVYALSYALTQRAEVDEDVKRAIATIKTSTNKPLNVNRAINIPNLSKLIFGSMRERYRRQIVSELFNIARLWQVQEEKRPLGVTYRYSAPLIQISGILEIYVDRENITISKMKETFLEYYKIKELPEERVKGMEEKERAAYFADLEKAKRLRQEVEAIEFHELNEKEIEALTDEEKADYEKRRADIVNAIYDKVVEKELPKETIEVTFCRVFLSQLDSRFAYITPEVFLEWGRNGNGTELYSVLLSSVLSNHYLHILTAYNVEKKLRKDKEADPEELEARIHEERLKALSYELNLDNIKKRVTTDYSSKRAYKANFIKNLETCIESFIRLGIISEGRIVKGSRGQDKVIFVMNPAYTKDEVPQLTEDTTAQVLEDSGEVSAF